MRTTTLWRRVTGMSDRLPGGSGTHSSRHLLLLALLAWAMTWTRVASGQEAATASAPASAPSAVSTPAAAKTPATKPPTDSKSPPASPPIQLYLGAAKDLLPQEQWD